MRRSLVLSDDRARHPFRAGLPRHVCHAEREAGVRRPFRLTAQDVKEFLMAYCACFMAASIFIA